MNAPVTLPMMSLELASRELKPVGVDRIPIKNREQWLAERKGDVTASVAGAILGVHEYVTPYGLHMEKAGLAPEQEQVAPVIDADSITLPPLLRGTLFERAAIDMVRMLRPDWEVAPANDAYFRMREARIGATPDAFARRPDIKGIGAVQIKTTDGLIFRQKWLDEDGNVQVPLWIAVQALCEAKLTGASWACVALMVGGINTKLHLIDIPLHEGVWSRLVDEVREFWRRVEESDPPDPDYGRDGALIAGLYAQDDGTEVDLSGDNRIGEILDERAELKAKEADGSSAAKKRKELDNEILAKLGTAARARLADGRTITAKTIKRSGYSVQPSSYRQIKVKGEAA